MAQEYVLAASAARTTGANGTATLIGGFRKRVEIVLDVTASAAVAGDTLDVYVDVSPDGTKWINAAHFAQQAGNGAAKTEVAWLDPSDPGTDTVAVTSDCAAGKQRAYVWGKYIRARWAIVDAGAHGQSHTFSVTAYCQ